MIKLLSLGARLLLLVCIIVFMLMVFINCSLTDSKREREPTPDLTPDLTPDPTSTPVDTIHYPKTLLIYYGWPSAINGSFGDTDLAASHFKNYDYIVLGSGLEETSHGDHLNTITIINHQDTIDTIFFGYIDLGVSTQNYLIPEIQEKVDNWLTMGVDGIFFDDFGYDFGVTRQRQNDVVSFVHSRDSFVCANAWNPDHACGSQIHSTYNPEGKPSQLNSMDFYLSESYQITVGTYQSETEWKNKAELLENYRNTIGISIFTITTNNSEDLYDENKFFYSWYSALLYNYEAAGWGEYWFSSNDSNASFRSRPAINPGDYFITDIIDSSPLLFRNTDTGMVWINFQTHESGFTSDS